MARGLEDLQAALVEVGVQVGGAAIEIAEGLLQLGFEGFDRFLAHVGRVGDDHVEAAFLMKDFGKVGVKIKRNLPDGRHVFSGVIHQPGKQVRDGCPGLTLLGRIRGRKKLLFRIFQTLADFAVQKNATGQSKQGVPADDLVVQVGQRLDGEKVVLIDHQ